MAAISELHKHIQEFASLPSSRKDFEDWFFRTWWDLEATADDATARTFRRVEGSIAEASHAGWSDLDLAENLAESVPALVRQ